MHSSIVRSGDLGEIGQIFTILTIEEIEADAIESRPRKRFPTRSLGKTGVTFDFLLVHESE
ncbi:hypothetical protein PMAYCL1PPCAC_27472, partial [Pristionchus mayeri]